MKGEPRQNLCSVSALRLRYPCGIPSSQVTTLWPRLKHSPVLAPFCSLHPHVPSNRATKRERRLRSLLVAAPDCGLPLPVPPSQAGRHESRMKHQTFPAPRRSPCRHTPPTRASKYRHHRSRRFGPVLSCIYRPPLCASRAREHQRSQNSLPIATECCMRRPHVRPRRTAKRLGSTHFHPLAPRV